MAFQTIAPGENCWRTPVAGRAALLVDAANYFQAARAAMLEAERTIFIVGWDIDSRIRFAGEAPPDDGAPEALKDFLAYLVERRPALRIHLLLWDFSILYALEREPLPALNLDWSTPQGIEVCLDDIVPLGASHHQKVVVVDNSVAFCGGIDLAMHRWDTRDHAADQAMRVDPLGKSYKPFHDMQWIVDGEAATALADIVAERWENASCREPDRERGTGDPWPKGVEADFENCKVGIARTVAAFNGHPGIHEVERLYLDMIKAAERCIYIENQFITADTIAKALAEALADKPDLELVIVTSRDPHGFLEAHSMATGRQRFMSRFEKADVMDRVRLVHPAVDDGTKAGQDVLVHAKVMVVDDVLFRAGSSNLNNRSMGTDGECDLVFEATTPDMRETIAELRDDLLGEHLGMDAAAVALAIERAGSLRALIDERQDEARTLRLTDHNIEVNDELATAVQAVADPERPSDASQFIGDMMSARPGRTRVRGKVMLGGCLTVILFLVLVWQLSPLSELTDPETIEPYLQKLGGDPWAYLIVPLAFVVGSMVMFPVTVMIAATAFVFPPATAFIIGLGGSLLGAVVNYGLGMALGRSFLRQLMGRRLNRISRALARQGMLTVVTLRIVPIAPFTLINLVAGASHIRFREFAAGTVIGLIPGIATMTIFGNRLLELFKNPSATEIAWALVALALYFAVSFMAQRLLRRLGKMSTAKQAA